MATNPGGSGADAYNSALETRPQQDDLESGRPPNETPEPITTEELPLSTRILGVSAFATAVVQVSFENEEVKSQIPQARWVALAFYLCWALILALLFCGHTTAFRRHAKSIVLTALGLCFLVHYFFDLKSVEVLIYLPLIVNFSLTVPFTGPLLESAAFGAMNA